LNQTSIILYATTVLIWGSTWIAITFQLGEVDPLISVIYRMAMASVLLFVWCRLRRIKLRLKSNDHIFMMAQGACLFGLNYWMIYWSETYLPSGIIAVLFSLIVFFNIINARIFLRRPTDYKTLVGGVIGLSGICLLFYPELTKFESSGTAIKGALFAVFATFVASLGNMLATRNGQAGISVWAINAWGTLYGALLLTMIALLTGTRFSYDTSVEYTLSLIYLATFGTILAFGAYLKLLILIGPEKASYSGLLIPFVAIILSTIFEDYQWSLMAICGFLLAAFGNSIAMRR
jgi:drug/metabolite transporter (DMT)-like permease